MAGMSVPVILYLVATVAAAVETFQSRSFGWGAVTFIAGGLLASAL